MITSVPIDLNVISDAYEAMATAKVGYNDALEKSLHLNSVLEKEKAVALSNGTVQGKNDTERKAAVGLLFAGLIANVEDAERDTRTARLDVELAEIEVKRIETMIRWLK